MLIWPLLVCQHMRCSGTVLAMSHENRSAPAPPGAKPHDHDALKYQSTPFAVCRGCPRSPPVSKSTSARGAMAASVSVSAPVGRHAIIRV